MTQALLPLTVELLGFSERLRQAFLMSLNGPIKGVAKLATREPAALAILDGDAVGIAEAWQNYRQQNNPHCRAIVVTAAPEKRADLADVDAVIGKPIKLDELIDAIKRIDLHPRKHPSALTAQNRVPEIPMQEAEIDERTRFQRITPAPPPFPPASDASQVQPSVLDEDQEKQTVLPYHDQPATAVESSPSNPPPVLEKLFNVFELAKSKGLAIELRVGNRPWVIGFPDGRQVRVSSDEAFCRTSCSPTMPADAFGIFPALSALRAPGMRNESRESFLWWLAAEICANKRPFGIGADQRVFLRRWPDLTRLKRLPHAVPIAALLLRQPMRLDDVANSLAIPLQDVHTVAACCQMTGLLETAKRETDYLIQPVINPKYRQIDTAFATKALRGLQRS